MKKKIAAIVCAAAMLIPSVCIRADYDENNLIKTINDAAAWKDEYDSPFYSIGTASSNLYITTLRRLGKSYDYESYLNGLDGVAAGYGAEHNAADMQKTVLAVISSYGDAQNVGGRDLVADSTYMRDATAPLSKDGCDAYSWALIALEAGGYEIPDGASVSKDEIIASLLSYQNGDGGFGGVLSTAAAVTALAPYVNTSGAYTITQKQTGWTIDVSPEDAVESALAYLSEAQMKDGDWGNLNATAMTIIALDSVGVDCETSPYFSARDGNALDGLMSYKNKDGGFSYDEMKSDGESTSYALCALASHLGFKQGRAAFFRLDAGDTISLAVPTPSPAPSQSQTNSGTSSGAATTRPAATQRPTVTARPASTPRVVTPRPAATPKNTMRPTKTAAPAPSISPSARPSALPTPRPTRRPALVGPVEMPGPMPTESPEPNLKGGGTASHKTGNGKTAAIVLSVIALLLIAAFVTLTALKNRGKLNSNSLLGKLMGVAPEPPKTAARAHRRTEEHRKFEKRERYKERLKYSKRR